MNTIFSRTGARRQWRIPFRDGARGGQAAVELIVGLVAILVLFAGLLQVSSLVKAHTNTMVAARAEAGEQAMLAGPMLPLPRYVRDWETGDDGKRHTPDDTWTGGNAARFSDEVIARTVAADAEWRTWDDLDNKPNPVAGMRSTFNPSAHFGLVRGDAETRTDLVPAVRHLIYDAPHIELATEVWMTWTTGIY